MAFRFKQFTVEDDRSTMRVGTDAVLLGAWTDPGNAASILEIGTGCGVIALMLAQKSEARITTIDTDEESIKQAASNFLQSPWSDNLRAVHQSLSDHVNGVEYKYDLIVTNPPFFTASLTSPDPRKKQAKHTSGMDRKELLGGAKKLLHEDGRFVLILPVKENATFTAMAESEGLYPLKSMMVRPKIGKPVNRVISCFGFKRVEQSIQEELAIRKAEGTFTKEYIEFTKAYYFSLR